MNIEPNNLWSSWSWNESESEEFNSLTLSVSQINIPVYETKKEEKDISER